MAFIYTCGNTGLEGSLPKLIGAAVMFFIVYVIMIKFGLITSGTGSTSDRHWA